MFIASLIGACLLLSACADPTAPNELERQFRESLSNVRLTGQFSVDGRPGTREDSYEIQSISKVAGKTWLFRAKIGERAVVPIPLTVEWAGDTPVVTLTDLSIPGMGTYTARVLFYRGKYSGTWSAKEHGGELFGRIEKIGATSEVETPTPPKEPTAQ